jgi:aspartate carbamoyltransferase regulatory subunit
VRLPGFEPGSSTWQADVLNHSSEKSTEMSAFLMARLQPHIVEKIENTLIKLQSDAKAKNTVKANQYILKGLAKHTNLLEPEAVKKYISEAKTKTGKPITPETKNKWLFCYNNFCKYNGMKWAKPYYKVPEKAQETYKKDELLNSLVIIDEAHRLAPKEPSENEYLEKVKAILVDAVRTTRKYGLGWMFISQTLSSLSRDILDQIRIYVFGFGLGWGIERLALKDIIGGQYEALKLYQSFRDPQSSLNQKSYPFMTVGPISPLSFSGTPLFFNALKYPNDFLKVNFNIDRRGI